MSFVFINLNKFTSKKTRKYPAFFLDLYTLLIFKAKRGNRIGFPFSVIHHGMHIM